MVGRIWRANESCWEDEDGGVNLQEDSGFLKTGQPPWRLPAQIHQRSAAKSCAQCVHIHISISHDDVRGKCRMQAGSKDHYGAGTRLPLKQK